MFTLFHDKLRSVIFHVYYLPSQNPKEYMSVEINSGGGIRVAFLVDAQGGNSRQQVNTAIGKGIEFANGQPHIIKFSRTNGGKIFLLQVCC